MLEDKQRCEGFSDGVFAIATTLLVLELRLPQPGQGRLWADLGALWPSYLAFALSFFVIVGVWMNHLGFLRLVREVSRPFLLANSAMMLYVTFLPFPTHVLATHLGGTEAKVAVAFYCGVFILGNLTTFLLVETMVRGNLLRPDVDPRMVPRLRTATLVGLLVNVGATLVALVLPWLALVLAFAIRGWYLRLRFEPLPLLAEEKTAATVDLPVHRY